MTKRLTRDELVQYVQNVIEPDGRYTEQELDQQLLDFCINCPDPSAAIDIVIETMEPLTPEQMVDIALAMRRRDLQDVPASELPGDHALRFMKLEP